MATATKPHPKQSPQSLQARLRIAIRESGMTQVEVERQTGIAQSRLSRFMIGGGLNEQGQAALMELFGFSVVRNSDPASSGGTR